MRHAFLLLTLPALAVAVIAACSDEPSSDSEDVTGDDAGSTVIPPGSEPSSGPSGPAGSGLATGLPCDVQGILENRCIACHSTDDPPPLLDYDDLKAPSKKDPKKTIAEVALDEMRAKTMPPTPAVPPEDDEIASFEEWIEAGAPKNPIACTDPPPDGGAKDGGGDAGVDAGPKCTSGTFWTRGNDGSQLMNPGEACNACHQQQGGPNLRIGGTVYPTLREPDDCNGSAPPLRVVVTDSRNRVYNMQVNAAGNFLTRNGDRPRPPLRAVVTNGQQTRAMVGTVTSGDCNSCHTVNGTNGAPGRIMAPGP
ncbi:MAG: hypothetical protein KF795_08670 [Labilithrix sp.]|nr:hypothetical protein [Labilithrix sp.]